MTTIWFEVSQDGQMLNVGSSQTLKSKKYRALTEADLRLEPLSEEVIIFSHLRILFIHIIVHDIQIDNAP